MGFLACLTFKDVFAISASLLLERHSQKLQKSSSITEDQELDGEDLVQKATDNYIKKIDEAAEKKIQEIMTV